MNTTSSPLTADDIIRNICNSRGQFVRAIWKSEPAPAAAHKHTKLEKRTSAIVRAGINFSNLSAVKVGIEEGTRGEVQELPWGSWSVDENGKSLFPYVIEHTSKGSDTPTSYIRLYPSDTKATTQYFVNGETVDRDKFAEYLTPSAAKGLTDGEKPLCFTVKRENILGIEDFEG